MRHAGTRHMQANDANPPAPPVDAAPPENSGRDFSPDPCKELIDEVADVIRDMCREAGHIRKLCGWTEENEAAPAMVPELRLTKAGKASLRDTLARCLQRYGFCFKNLGDEGYELPFQDTVPEEQKQSLRSHLDMAENEAGSNPDWDKQQKDQYVILHFLVMLVNGDVDAKIIDSKLADEIMERDEAGTPKRYYVGAAPGLSTIDTRKLMQKLWNRPDRRRLDGDMFAGIYAGDLFMALGGFVPLSSGTDSRYIFSLVLAILTANSVIRPHTNSWQENLFFCHEKNCEGCRFNDEGYRFLLSGNLFQAAVQMARVWNNVLDQEMREDATNSTRYDEYVYTHVEVRRALALISWAFQTLVERGYDWPTIEWVTQHFFAPAKDQTPVDEFPWNRIRGRGNQNLTVNYTVGAFGRSDLVKARSPEDSGPRLTSNVAWVHHSAAQIKSETRSERSARSDTFPSVSSRVPFGKPGDHRVKITTPSSKWMRNGTIGRFGDNSVSRSRRDPVESDGKVERRHRRRY